MTQNANTVFLLQGESGEYEQRSETVYGVYRTEAEALAAMLEVPRLAAEGYARYKAFEARVEALASERGVPPVKTDFLRWTEQERVAWNAHFNMAKAIIKELGGRPPFFCKSDRYWITRLTIGETDKGAIVFDSEEQERKSA